MIEVHQLPEKGVSIISLRQIIMVNPKEVEEFTKKFNDLVSCYDISSIVKKQL